MSDYDNAPTDPHHGGKIWNNRGSPSVPNNRYDRWRSRREAMRKAEAEGTVADSMEVRQALMLRVHAGEITLEAAQAELARIKRNAKKNGLITRDQASRSEDRI